MTDEPRRTGKQAGKGKSILDSPASTSVSEYGPSSRRRIVKSKIKPVRKVASAAPRLSETLAAVDIFTQKACRAEASLSQRFNKLKVTEYEEPLLYDDGEPSSASSLQDGEPNLEVLLERCTDRTIHAFSEVFGDLSIQTQIFGSKGPGYEIDKIGEASYSEVFGWSLPETEQVVVKIIPLLPAQGSQNLPDSSNPCDVAREIEVTRRLSSIPSKGFVGLLGYVILRVALHLLICAARSCYGENIRPHWCPPGTLGRRKTPRRVPDQVSVVRPR